jgi:hypothetical protein
LAATAGNAEQGLEPNASKMRSRVARRMSMKWGCFRPTASKTPLIADGFAQDRPELAVTVPVTKCRIPAAQGVCRPGRTAGLAPAI